MERKILPIGSVVLLKDDEKKFLIYGRMQRDEGSKKIWDYLGVLYPQGYFGKNVFVFNHGEIDKVCFLGFVTTEEEQYLQGLFTN